MALSVDVPPEAVAAMSSLASVAALIVAPLGGCGRCSRPGGTDARPLRATQQRPSTSRRQPQVISRGCLAFDDLVATLVLASPSLTAAFLMPLCGYLPKDSPVERIPPARRRVRVKLPLLELTCALQERAKMLAGACIHPQQPKRLFRC